MTIIEMQIAMQHDHLLSKVVSYTLEGCLVQAPKQLEPYKAKTAELAVGEGCLLWGGRMVFPQFLKEPNLTELHGEHLGISQMKLLAQSHIW